MAEGGKMKEQAGKFEQHIEFRPAYDKRNADPAKNYGRHCVDAFFVLKGPEGAVELQAFTGWELPHLRDDRGSEAIGAYLRFHSPKSRYDGDIVDAESCVWLDEKPCYCGVTSLGAEPVFDILVEGGLDALWIELERLYHAELG